jgi:alkylation response protein AidB-like acyl-CoA dehydrogenase
MDFQFSEDQLLLQKTVQDFLAAECTPEVLRGLWTTETGRSPALWQSLAEMGVMGLQVPEAAGGMGMDERDFVLVLEETGRYGLAEPVISTAAVAAPLLAGLLGGERDAWASKWLGRIASGDAVVAVGHAQSPFVSDAHVADLLVLPNGDDIHAIEPSAATITAERSNDQSRRLFSLAWSPSDATRIATGAEGAALQGAAFDRGVLACAAQLLGVGQQLIDMGALYATQRKQFGVAIGTFQAVKHRLANAKVKVEYARSLVYRAAHSVAAGIHTRANDVSMAKLAAAEAALFSSKEALQVHGAIGYTYEQDLHVWMKRAWSLDLAYGSGPWHRARLAKSVIDREPPAESFGYTAPSV